MGTNGTVTHSKTRGAEANSKGLLLGANIQMSATPIARINVDRADEVAADIANYALLSSDQESLIENASRFPFKFNGTPGEYIHDQPR